MLPTIIFLALISTAEMTEMIAIYGSLKSPSISDFY